MSISIYIADPCTATTLKRVSSTATTNPGLATLTVINGASLSQDFTKAMDTIEIAQNIDGLCGTRTYKLCYNADCTAV